MEKKTGTCGMLRRKHVDHVAEKVYVGIFHHVLVHKPVSIH